MAKAKTLRPGLTVEDLKKGCWVNEPDRYRTEHEIEGVVDEAVNMVLQAFIDRANAGERVHSKTISNTCCAISDSLKALKDSINSRLQKDELVPGVLDEIAAAVGLAHKEGSNG
jgi:hypothetical protein